MNNQSVCSCLMVLSILIEYNATIMSSISLFVIIVDGRCLWVRIHAKFVGTRRDVYARMGFPI